MLNNKIFVIDDVKEICLFIKSALKKYDIDTEFSHTAKDALEKLKKNNDFDVILLDYKLPDMNGFELLKKIQTLDLLKDTKVILITAYEDVDTGVEAIQRGCFDYIAKPFNDKNLIFRIKHAMENTLLNEKVKKLSQPLLSGFENIIGNSKEMQKIYKIINQIANKDTTVLIEGETGTGKEVIARAIHDKSSRKNNKFIPVNCGALTESLLESELFGYEKGAFTGAVSKKYVILEVAGEGTVFLDEINNASVNVQAKLLRFIEMGEFMRVGGNIIIKCDTRIVIASNQNIESLVEAKKFREDVYHRINVVRLVLPPLSHRTDDIPLLADHFLNMYNKKFGKKVELYKSTVNYLSQFQWTGNVRQLKNMIHSLVLLNETGVIKPGDLPKKIMKDNILLESHLSFKENKNRIINDFEIAYLKNILTKTKGNVSKASKISKLSRRLFIDKLKLYNIDPSIYKTG